MAGGEAWIGIKPYPYLLCFFEGIVAIAPIFRRGVLGRGEVAQYVFRFDGWLLQGEIVGVDVALRVPAMDVDDDAGLGSAGCEGNAQWSVAGATGPV
jgi:hypothetical protein